MHQIVRTAIDRYWPDLSDHELDLLLWECTAFPASTDEQTAARLKYLAKQAGGDLNEAINLSITEFNDAMGKL